MPLGKNKRRDGFGARRGHVVSLEDAGQRLQKIIEFLEPEAFESFVAGIALKTAENAPPAEPQNAATEQEPPQIQEENEEI